MTAGVLRRERLLVRPISDPERHDDLLADLRNMADHGETLIGAAQRVGMTDDGLEHRLRKRGNVDVLHALLANIADVPGAYGRRVK